MESLHEAYFGMIYSIVRKQNAILLKDIARREKLVLTKIYKEFLPTKRKFQTFITHHCPPDPLNRVPLNHVGESGSA